MRMISSISTPYVGSRYGKITKDKAYKILPSNLQWGYYKFLEDKGLVVHCSAKQIQDVFGYCPACEDEEIMTNVDQTNNKMDKLI